MEPKDWTQNRKLVLQNEKLEMLKKQVSIEEQTFLKQMDENEQFDYFVSKLNYFRRKNALSCLDFNVYIRIGDICYIDYGLSYIHEIGYLHFGLIVSMNRDKVLVVPITGSNTKTMRKIGDTDDHIVNLGKIEGMRKICACYINDAKWINTARIIDVKSRIPVRSKQFQDIKQRLKESID